MKDTAPAIEALYRRLLLEKSSAQRLVMGCHMFDSARAILRASLRERGAERPDADLRVQLLLRTYGGDFSPPTLERIAQRLGSG